MKTPQFLSWILPGLLMLCIFSASSSSELALPDPGFKFPKDKIGHFLVFGLLGTLFARLPLLTKYNWKGAIAASLAAIAFGAIDEWRQSFTPGRSVEFADWVADSLGAITAITLYRRCRPYRWLLELQLKRIPRMLRNKKARNLFRSFGP